MALKLQAAQQALATEGQETPKVKRAKTQDLEASASPSSTATPTSGKRTPSSTPSSAPSSGDQDANIPETEAQYFVNFTCMKPVSFTYKELPVEFNLGTTIIFCVTMCRGRARTACGAYAR